MRIIDLTSEYRDFLENNDLEKYELAYPTFFKHYFNFWTKRKNFRPILKNYEVGDRMRNIQTALPAIEEKFKKAGIDTKDISIILFVGSNVTNGHAFRNGDGKFVVWIPIESYTSLNRAKVFLTHEIIHYLQYSADPSYYFSSKDEMVKISNCLATEGLATFLTKEILGISDKEAIFGDYLTGEESDYLLKQYSSSERKLTKFVKKSFLKADTGLFNATDKKDIWKYKAGYVLGLNICREIAKSKFLSSFDLLGVKKKEFLKIIYRQLD